MFYGSLKNIKYINMFDSNVRLKRWYKYEDLQRCFAWWNQPGAHPLRSFATHPWDKRNTSDQLFSCFWDLELGKILGRFSGITEKLKRWNSINFWGSLGEYPYGNSWTLLRIYSLWRIFWHDSISVATVRFSTLKKWHLPWPTVHFTLRLLRFCASPTMDNNG